MLIFLAEIADDLLSTDFSTAREKSEKFFSYVNEKSYVSEKIKFHEAFSLNFSHTVLIS